MSNNVRHIRSFSRPADPVKPILDREPTPLQRAVLARAQELRERENRPRERTPLQWAAAAMLALVCLGFMYGAVDLFLRKMQHLAEGFSTAPVATESPPADSPPAVEQSQVPDQPYFIDLQQHTKTGKE